MSGVKILGSYYLHDTLGTTDASTRYRALVIGPDGFEKFVLVDRLSDGFVRDDDRRVELERVVALLRQLEHPNLSGIRELTRIRDDSLLVRDSIAGASLRSLMSRLQRTKTALTIDEGLYLALEILRALEAAERFGHERGEPLVHANLHPGSVIIGYNGEVQVVGLGLDRLLGESDPEALPYRSPEQLRGVTNDPGSDVFGVAVILFELLTGAPLFQGRTQEETIVRVNAGLTVGEAQEKGFERELSEFFSRALDPRREFRFAGAAEAWAAIVNLAPRLDPAAAQQTFAERVRSVFETDIRREERRLQDAKAGLGLAAESGEIEESAVSASLGTEPVTAQPAPVQPTSVPASVERPVAHSAPPRMEPVAAAPAAPIPAAEPVQFTEPISLAPADEAPPPKPAEERVPAAPPPRKAPPEPEPDHSKPRVNPWSSARSKSEKPPAFTPSGRSTDEPPSGLIPHDQMHAMLEQIAKTKGTFATPPKAAPPPTFTPSGKSTEEPPSGLIPSDQMHAMLSEIAKKSPHFTTERKAAPPPKFVPSGKSTEEPPSGLILSSEMHAMMQGGAPQVHRPHSEPRSSADRTGPVQLRLPTKPPAAEARTIADAETAPLRRVDEQRAPAATQAKRGCLGLLVVAVLPCLGLTALLLF